MTVALITGANKGIRCETATQLRELNNAVSNGARQSSSLTAFEIGRPTEQSAEVVVSLATLDADGLRGTSRSRTG